LAAARLALEASILAQQRESVMQCGQVVQEGRSMQRTQSSSECCIEDLKMQVNLLQ
jgi:hypothetical protein